MTTTTGDELAAEIVEWHDREWPSPDGTPAEIERIVMKLTEEVGELSGALVKHLQGRTDKAWLDEAAKEYGDVLIVMSTLADRMDELCDQAGDGQVTLDSMWRARWADVSQRRGATYRQAAA